MRTQLPFYLVTFNRVKGLISALEYVERSELPLELIILDMGSTWPPFLELLKSLPNRVIYFANGVGPRGLWTNGALVRCGDGPFFLSDGDIDYTSVPNDAFTKMAVLSQLYPWFPKIGLALEVSDLPKDKEGERIKQWSKYDWAVLWNQNTYLCGLDTTIAYYPRRERKFYYRPALRIAGNFTARHYPWYERESDDDPEFDFYRTVAVGAISTGQQALFPSKSFKFKSFIRLLLMESVKAPLHNPILGKVCIKILAWRGTIKEYR